MTGIRGLFCATAALMVLLTVPTLAQEIYVDDLPICDERPTVETVIRFDFYRWCLESVYQHPDDAELNLTALAFAEDGSLYVARPLYGEVLVMRDSDGDRLPDSPQVVVGGLTLPNALAVHDGQLYIAGGAFIHRYDPAADALEMLVDDLPSGTGFWTGGLAVGPDERLYLSTGAPCDFCEPDDPARGAVLSYRLDGSDRQIVASGLRHPAGLAWHRDRLWVTDSARDDLMDVPWLDELNRVPADGAHFGWPYCIGADNQPDMLSDAFDCAEATAPYVRFRTHANPIALTSNSSDALFGLDGALIVALGGAPYSVDLRGYEIVAVLMDEDLNPIGYETLVPFGRLDIVSSVPYSANRGYSGTALERYSYEGDGLWPHRPYGLAVSPEGWLYFTLGGGRIMAIRAGRVPYPG